MCGTIFTCAERLTGVWYIASLINLPHGTKTRECSEKNYEQKLDTRALCIMVMMNDNASDRDVEIGTENAAHNAFDVHCNTVGYQNV